LRAFSGGMSSVSELDAGGGGVSRVSREDTPSLSPAPPVSDTVTTPKGGEKSAGSIEAAGKHDLAQNLPPNAARVANADGGVRVSGSGNELSTEHDPAASVPNAASVTGRPGATNETADTDKTNAQAPATRRRRHRRGGGSRGARAGGAHKADTRGAFGKCFPSATALPTHPRTRAALTQAQDQLPTNPATVKAKRKPPHLAFLSFFFARRAKI
jgi:hypothetical protein